MKIIAKNNVPYYNAISSRLFNEENNDILANLEMPVIKTNLIYLSVPFKTL